MFNVDFNKEVQVVDGLALVQFTKELYAPWLPEKAVNEIDDHLHLAGGAIASPWIDEMTKEIQGDLYEPACRFMEHHGIQKDSLKGMMWIHVGLLGAMSKEHKLAIIGHEVAHIALGHIKDYIDENGGVDAAVRKYRKSGIIPVMDSPERELEADAYSASIHGRRAMHDALESIISNDVVIEFNARKYGVSVELVKAAFRSRAAERLAALA